MIPLQAVRIADQLGGLRIFPKRVSTYDRLREAVESGLPRLAVQETLSIFPPDVRRQLEQKLDVGNETTLSRSSSERLERLARVIALTRATYANDDAGAVSFLVTPNRNLGKETPIQRALSEIGARQVEDLLVRIAYGFPS